MYNPCTTATISRLNQLPGMGVKATWGPGTMSAESIAQVAIFEGVASGEIQPPPEKPGDPVWESYRAGLLGTLTSPVHLSPGDPVWEAYWIGSALREWGPEWQSIAMGLEAEAPPILETPRTVTAKTPWFLILGGAGVAYFIFRKR